MELYPHQTFVAQDGPYKGQVLKIVGEDPAKPGQDRWLFQSPDKKQWGAPGARLRAVLEQQLQAQAAASTTVTPPADPAAKGNAPQAEAAPLVPQADDAAHVPASVAEAPSVAAEPTATAQPAKADPLDFAHTPVKILLQLWPDEGQGRTAWLGGDLPDQNPLWQPVKSEQLEALLALLAGLLGQLEQEFPTRQAKIVAALAAQQRGTTPPRTPPPAQASHAKPAPRHQPVAQVPAKPGAGTTAEIAGPSPERQAFPATIQQPDMFAGPEALPGAATQPA